MDRQKQKQAKSREMDALVVACALGQYCDDAELVRLAIEYAQYRSPYQISATHMRTLETPEEKAVATELEAKVNNVITKTIRRSGSMGTMGRLAMERFSMQPSSGQKPILQSCKCTGTNRSPDCKMPPELCKYSRSMLSASIPRKSKDGGKNKNKSKRLNHKKRFNRSKRGKLY